MKSLNKYVFFLLMLSSVMVACNNNSKVVYIDVNLLYESFEYKKNLASEYNKIKSTRDRILDSLEQDLSSFSVEITTGRNSTDEFKRRFESKKDEFLQYKQQFEEDNEALRTSYDSKIIKQLNAYIKEFGDKSSYDLIVGADNEGSVLYGRKDLDKTKELIEFVNNRFKGEKK